MGVEIERKFLLNSDEWRNHVDHQVEMHQGYLSRDAQASVRIRITDKKAILGIKSTRDGIYRLEYEYMIPRADAREIMAQIAHRPLIEKTRYIVHWGKHLWEIDEFHGENAGLIVAEVELASVDEQFDVPPWLGQEISTDARYYNSNLSRLPYSSWKENCE